jgi:hypothetical protein
MSQTADTRLAYDSLRAYASWKANQYNSALADVRGLMGEDTPDASLEANPEYMRGQLELLAQLFSRPGADTTERVLQIARDLGITRNVYEACDESDHTPHHSWLIAYDVSSGGRR